MSGQMDKVTHIIEPIVEGLGYELVRVKMMQSPQGGRQILQIMAERPDGTMLIEDCEKISRELSVVMDVEDPISGEYALEVSSPGLDRPLTRRKDFEKYAGYVVKVEAHRAVDKRKRYRGQLIGLQDDAVIVEVDGEHHAIEFENIN